MPAAALDVVGVHGPPAHGVERVLQEAGLVQRVGVQGDGEVGLLGDAQAGVDGVRAGAPVLVDLEPAGPGEHRPLQELGRAGRPAGEERGVDRCAGPGGHQRVQVGRGVGADVPDAADAHADQRRHAGRQRGRDEVGVGEVDVGVHGAGRGDEALARHHRGVGVDDELDAVLDVRVPGTAHADDAPVGDTDRGLADPEDGVEQQDAQHHHVEGAVAVARGRRPARPGGRSCRSRRASPRRARCRRRRPRPTGRCRRGARGRRWSGRRAGRTRRGRGSSPGTSQAHGRRLPRRPGLHPQRRPGGDVEAQARGVGAVVVDVDAEPAVEPVERDVRGDPDRLVALVVQADPARAPDPGRARPSRRRGGRRRGPRASAARTAGRRARGSCRAGRAPRPAPTARSWRRPRAPGGARRSRVRAGRPRRGRDRPRPARRSRRTPARPPRTPRAGRPARGGGGRARPRCAGAPSPARGG